MHGPVMLRSLNSQKMLWWVNIQTLFFGEELDHMEGKVHLESDPNVAPTVMLLRRVPVALIEKLKNEIDCFNSEESDQPYSRTYRLDFKHDCSQEARREHSFVHWSPLLKSSLKWKPLPSPRDRRVISNMHNHPCFTCVNNLSRFKST